MPDKAVILGINDYKNVNSLRGCVSDTETMKALLVEVYKFPEKNVRTLTNEHVVKSEVKKQLAWLFQGAKPGDRAVLHFSGHGSFIDDRDGDEPDGRDELIALYDMDFDDPNTYLLDDELREWTKTKPPGVALTVVLDNCNSGTATRMLMPSGQEVLIDKDATLKRSLAEVPVSRGLDAASMAARALHPDNPELVRVRFIDPPQEIKDRVDAARARARARAVRTRDFVKVKGLNHVLLAGCRSDQTSADATIDGRPCGAFTFYLNRTVRSGGANMNRKPLIDKVAAGLRDGHFAQIPQLEGPGDGPLFQFNTRDAGDSPADESELLTGPGPQTETGPIEPPRDGPEPSETGDASFLLLLDRLALLDVESRRRVLDLYERWFGAAPTRGARAGSLSGQRFLVTVHGICRHVAGFSDGWFDSLHPFTNEFGAGRRGESRREVLWSDLVNARAIVGRAANDEQDDLAEQIKETLEDRVDRHAIDAGPRSEPGEAPRALSDTRGLVSIPGLNCIDDFLVYMTNDSVRAAVLKRFTDVVRPLLEGGGEIDVISHSWGTVVAYEGLRELADVSGLTSPRIRNFFTVGAALSIAPVKARLRPANRDGRRPAMVRRWVNMNAHGDPVGGPLQGRPYAVDFDFPNLVAFGCSSFLGIVDPGCAHGSYFNAGNLPTNRDIFGNFVNRP